MKVLPKNSYPMIFLSGESPTNTHSSKIRERRQTSISQTVPLQNVQLPQYCLSLCFVFLISTKPKKSPLYQVYLPQKFFNSYTTFLILSECQIQLYLPSKFTLMPTFSYNYAQLILVFANRIFFFMP